MAPSRREFMKASLAAGVVLTVGSEAVSQTPVQEVHGHTSKAPGALPDGYTMGLGVYPGESSENFGPTMIPAGQERRNLALMRPAYHSSSYDYNLTAQLITDGIRHTRMPEWVSVSVDGRVLPRTEREIVLDHFDSSALEMIGAKPVIEVHFGGGDATPAIDRIDAFVAVPGDTKLDALRFTAFTSPDGHVWKAVGTAGAPKPVSGESYPPDLARGNALLNPSIPFAKEQQARFYRFQLEVQGASPEHFRQHWNLGELKFYAGGNRVEIGGPYHFTSAWKSDGLGEEWVYVDLGVPSAIDHVTLHWIAPAADGKVQVSNDAKQWRNIAVIHGAAGKEDIPVSPVTRARYVRALLTRPATADGYILSEMEVFGRGGLRAQAKPATTSVDANGRLHLAGGNWRLQRADGVSSPGEALSRAGFADDAWLVATVPGTVLTSYLNAGAIPDPNFGANQLQISDSYFYSDFWYRMEFTAPGAGEGELQWLEFDGINWKADVFLNGARLGRIEGAFQRARYNVTGKLKASGPNALAVRIEKNATPGSAKQKTYETPGKNGGALGADNPTFHSSVGWDWIPTIRGRNTGIWNSVALNSTSMVTLEDPAVTTVLSMPERNLANVTLALTVVNHANGPVAGAVRCRFGEIELEQPVSLGGGERKDLAFTPQTHPQLAIENPRLWWPAGYGNPELYDVEIVFAPQGAMASKPLKFKAGLRQITASEEGGALRLWVNGRRVVAKGGNWGFSESMLRYRAREYDAAVRYHREMNFNMIRNWVGQIGEDAFYEACDRHGVLVWQDFWLANPWDGPVPNDNEMFLKNARDLLLRIRMHPCMGIYCGRNEWYPPKPLDDGLRAHLKELHPDLHYIGSSADGPVSGHGPYQALPPETYFRLADTKLHSEIGAPNIPTYESVRGMMPSEALWPQGLEWGLHDFCLKGAQGGASFRSIIDEGYGGANDANEWIRLAQFVNYDTYRAIFEAQGKNRMGVLLWMSHPCWPSFVWQTYDYYLEPTAAYFGCKKACEPLHIQWNPLTEKVEVVNVSGGDQKGLNAKLQILDVKGKVIAAQTANLASREDSLTEAFAIAYPPGLTEVQFLRLTLQEGSRVLSSNFYIRGREAGNRRAVRAIPLATVKATTSAVREQDRWKLTTILKNVSSAPALMIQARAVRSRSRDRILPAVYSDNFIALMPNEQATLLAEVRHADTRGETPGIAIQGFNLA